MESSFILSLQKALSSDLGKSLIGFCARWVIYLFVPFILAARISKAMRHAVIETAWTAGLAFAISTLLATLIGRVRPYLAVAGVQAIVPPNIQAGSFPSSHTAVAIGIATALSFYNVPLGVAAFAMAILVAFGRVAAGMHYPTDVLGGAVVGIIAFMLVRVGHNAIAHLK